MSIPWGRSLTLTVILPVLAIWLIANEAATFFQPPQTGDPAAHHSSFGPVRLRARLPGTHAGIPEPLVVCGRIGRASLVYIRLIDGGRARVGIDFWGIESDESEAFYLPSAEAEIQLTCYLPVFFRPPGFFSRLRPVRNAPIASKTDYLLMVNGVTRLRGSIDYPQPAHSAIYFGENPLGGSVVSNRFTGVILQATQDN